MFCKLQNQVRSVDHIFTLEPLRVVNGVTPISGYLLSVIFLEFSLKYRYILREILKLILQF